MALGDGFRRVFNVLAGMGLIITDDPPKVVELKGREWGLEAQGLALSIQNRPETLSVVLRNVSKQPISLTIPTLLNFYQVRTDAPLSPYGEALRKSERKEHVTVELKSGEATETGLPLKQMFSRTSGYRFQLICELPDGTRLESNEITAG
jgi:hypothetical protein